jgi:hypothetical protein
MPDVVLLTVDSVRRDFVDAIADHEVLTDVTAGHYTRPSLAAVQSSRLRASVQSRVVGPTIVEAFSDAGYTTIGLVPTAQADPAFGFDSGFDHYDNYLSESGNAASNRRSGLREYLGSYDIVRQVYRRVYPMEATRDDLSAVRGTTHEQVSRNPRAIRMLAIRPLFQATGLDSPTLTAVLVVVALLIGRRPLVISLVATVLLTALVLYVIGRLCEQQLAVAEREHGKKPKVRYALGLMRTIFVTWIR